MITAYRMTGEALQIPADEIAVGFGPDIAWLDLVNPTREEETRVEEALGISVPTREDMKDIEPSSRLFVEGGDTFITASLVYKSETEHPDLADVAFILTGSCLLTVRYADPRSFRLFAAALQRGTGSVADAANHSQTTAAHLLARLMETIVDRTAEIMEQEAARIDALSAQVFTAGTKRRPPRYLEERLLDVASRHRMLSKVRESLASLARVTTFLQSVPAVQADQDARALCNTVSRDVQSLSEHVSFMSGNITFLLDASLGLINVEQNAIIKIFSIASVVFLPPTLVASIYGMNFRFMPETEWTLGYPMSLAAMLVSAVVPFYFFRWKGWL